MLWRARRRFPVSRFVHTSYADPISVSLTASCPRPGPSTQVANNSFVTVLVTLLGLVDVREAAAECLHDICHKGMEPLSKVQLVESLFGVLEQASVFALLGTVSDQVSHRTPLAATVQRLMTGLICVRQDLTNFLLRIILVLVFVVYANCVTGLDRCLAFLL